MEKEERSKKRKVIITSSISILVLLLIVGISYAFWQATKIQGDANIIASGCFGVELEGNEAIKISNAYPVDKERGMKGVPYTFTITNTCSGSANYIVNLESLSNTTFQNTSIRVALDNTDKLYSDYVESTKYFEDSKEARTLISGALEENGSVTYNLRIWIDEEAPNSEQNKIFASKIVVTTGEGEIIKHLADQVELGDYISMTPTSTNYVIPAGITGYESSQSINPSELNLWRVISKNADGSVDVVSEYVSSDKVTFKGKTGYINYVGVLNMIASQYTNSKYVQSTRHMGYNGQTEYITDTSKIDSEIVPWQSFTENIDGRQSPLHGNQFENLGGGDDLYKTDVTLVKESLGSVLAKSVSNSPNISICLASRYYNYISDTSWRLCGTCYNESRFEHWIAEIHTNGTVTGGLSMHVRPIVTLKKDVHIKDGDGNSFETAYVFDN